MKKSQSHWSFTWSILQRREAPNRKGGPGGAAPGKFFPSMITFHNISCTFRHFPYTCTKSGRVFAAKTTSGPEVCIAGRTAWPQLYRRSVSECDRCRVHAQAAGPLAEAWAVRWHVLAAEGETCTWCRFRSRHFGSICGRDAIWVNEWSSYMYM